MVPLAACVLAAWVAPASVVPGSALQALGAHHIAVLIPGSVATAILPAVAGAEGLGDAAAGSTSAAAGAVRGGPREGRRCLLPSSTAVASKATAAIVTCDMGEYSAGACLMARPVPCVQQHLQQQGPMNQSSSSKQAACT